MKKVVLALALFAFVGSSAVTAAPVNGDKEKTEKKDKKNKKKKKGACTPAEMKACGPKEGAAAATGGKSCCAKKTASAEAAPVQAQ